MSDTISFRFEGEKDEWLYYKHQLEKQGITVKEKLSSMVSQEIALMNGSQEAQLKTASRHSDELSKNLPGLSKAIEEGKYHVTISDTEFLKAAGHDISKFVSGAVHSGITNYWLMKIAKKRVPTDPQEFQKYKSEKGCSEELSIDQAVSQEVTKLLMSSRLQGFYKVVESVTVSFSIDIPMLSLHSLTEGHLNDIIQFNCNIIGTSELKLETTSNKYFQEVLVQEPEDETDGETPRIMKVIVHGEDTKGMSTGKLKKIVGFYRTREPKNGEKVDELKKLVIDKETCNRCYSSPGYRRCKRGYIN
jgi:hypothetical protein